jgi:hypothetical protein
VDGEARGRGQRHARSRGTDDGLKGSLVASNLIISNLTQKLVIKKYSNNNTFI